MLQRDDCGPHIGRVAPDEPELETAEGNSTEDNVFSIEVADDALDEADDSTREAKDDISADEYGHEVDNGGRPMKNVVKYPKRITWLANIKAQLNLCMLPRTRILPSLLHLANQA